MKTDKERIDSLEFEVDRLKEIILQFAWELEYNNKKRLLTVKEEEHLKKRYGKQAKVKQ